MSDIVTHLRRLRVIPVIAIDDAADAVALADALIGGGLPCVEVTLRTTGAVEALRRMTGAFPDLLVGAGTVLTTAQAAVAVDAGARFIVAPGFDRDVVAYCQSHDVPVFPGICTPTELTMAVRMGIRVVKYFPAEAVGGLPLLEAIATPFPGVEFIPTGGLGPDRLARYLANERVVACGGSWMARAEWIRARQFERVRAETERTVAGLRAIAAEG